jgi:GAG-pre-integrase domain
MPGRGTVELESTYNDFKYLLRLKNFLYIPNNWNNLISLGCWDRAGGRYIGGGGAIKLITKDGKHVARGTKIDNNLYKMKVSIRKPGAINSKSTTCTPQTFQAAEPTQSWEIWHKRYGHIGYSGLQKLLDLNLIDGFTVDTRTPKPDCMTCTEAKQTEEPFNKFTEPSELTHIDVSLP